MNPIFICILAISLLLTGIPHSAIVMEAKAESVKSGNITEGLTWQYGSDGTLTIRGNGSMPDYTTVNNCYTGITTDAPWGDYLSDITKVVVSGNVNNIGKCAFSDCTSIEQVSLSSSVKEIGQSAFARCTGLKSISFPNTLVSIGEEAFRGCTGITHVIIPDSVTIIGSGTFQACTNLTDISLGKSISSIKSYTFSNCTKLANIEIPQNITSIGTYAFSLCSAISELNIPISVSSISDEAFSNCSSLKKVTVNNDALYFGQRVFNNCSSNFVLYSNSGSTSDVYAEKNAHAFVALNAENADLKINSFVIDKESGQKIGTKINLSVKVSGGTAPYKYSFYYKKSNESEKSIQSYSNVNSIDYNLGEAGNYIFGVRVKDDKNTIIEQEIVDYRVIGFTNFAGGNGTAENPYIISDVSMFCEMGNYDDAHFILISNLDLSNIPRINEFKGIFDGNGNTVTVGLSEKNGLFNSVVEGSEVKNLVVNVGTNKTLPVEEYGAVAIRNEGRIENCHVKGSITVNNYQIGYKLFGGITAYNTEPGVIEKCRDSISVNLNDIVTNEAFGWGGIAGNSISGKITKCLIENDFNITIRPMTSGYQTRIGSIAGVFGYSNISECAINTNVSIAHLSYTSNYCLSYGVFAGDEWYTYDHGLSLASELNGIASCYIPEDFSLSVNFKYYGSGGGLNSKYEIYTKDNIKNVKTMSSDKIAQWFKSLVDDYKPIEIKPLDITSFKASGNTVGENVRLDAMVTGGTGLYSITFSYILNGIETVLSNDALLTYDLFLPTEEGAYDFIVSVKDSNGDVVTRKIEGHLISKIDDGNDNEKPDEGDSGTEKSFQLGKDNNSFEHMDGLGKNGVYDLDNGKYGFYEIENYKINSDYTKEKLLKLTSSIGELSNLLKSMEKKWTGVCYGLAETIGLAYLGILDINDISDKPSEDFYSLIRPCNNQKLLDTINYYYLTQFLKNYGLKSNDCISTYYEESNSFFNKYGYANVRSNSDFYHDLVNIVDEKYMVMLGYMKKDGTGHAIVTCGVKKVNEKTFEIKLYDENVITHYDKLIITENNGEYNCRYDSKSNFLDNIVSMFYMPLDNLSNIKPYTARSLMSSEQEERKDTMTIIFAVGQEFKIITSNGKYLQYDGSNFSGNIVIHDIQNIIDGVESELMLEIDSSDNITYIPYDDGIDLTIYNDYNYYAVSASNINNVIVDLRNGISMNGNDYEFDAYINRLNDGKTEVASISGIGAGNVMVSLDLENQITMDAEKNVKNLSVDLITSDESINILNDADGNCLTLGEEKQITIKSTDDGQIIEENPKPTDKSDTTVSPNPTDKPDIIGSPEPTTQPNATQNPEPTNGTNIPLKRTIVIDRKNNVSYRVIAPGKTVEFYKVNNKKATKIVIPATVTISGIKYKVTAISDNAFSGCKKLKSVSIGKYVTSIGNKTFFKCTSLKKIIIPASVIKIGKKAFYGCKKLKSITIKAKKLKSKSVGTQAFKGIYKKAVIKVPKKQKKAYTKWLRKKGITKKMKIK